MPQRFPRFPTSHAWLISEVILYSEESFGASVSWAEENEYMDFVEYVTFLHKMAKRGPRSGGGGGESGLNEAA